MENFKVGIALSGGGLCGVAHIGFLKALEEKNIQIDMVAGTSMGSVIGGLYASGWKVSDMEKEIYNISKNDIVQINFLKLLKEGLVSTKRLKKTLQKFLKVENFEDTKIEFCAQAVDLMKGKLVTFDKGSLVDAILASSAIPGIFPPVKKDDTLYIDGGYMRNIPYTVLKEKGADVVIAVNCLNEHSLDEAPKNIFSLLTNTFNLMICDTWKNQRDNDKGVYDIFCNDNTPGVTQIDVDFKKVSMLIESGYKSGLKYADKIKEIIKNKKNLSKTLDYSLEM